MTPHDLIRALFRGRHGTGPSDHAVLTGGHAALYDRFVARWLLGGFYRAVAEQVAAGTPRDGSVLDVGTGPGRLLVALGRARPDLHLVGIDPSRDMVAYADRSARTAGSSDRIHVQVAAAEALPFGDGTFDAVVSTLSSHHWSDLATGVRELARVLRPAGQVWLYDLRGATEARLTETLGTQFPSVEVSSRRIGGFAGLRVACFHAVKPAPSPSAAATP